MKPHLARQLFFAAALLALGIALIVDAMRPAAHEVFADTFSPDAYFDAHVVQDRGWTQREGLAIAARQAIRAYQFPKRADQRVFLTVNFRQPKGGTNRLHIQKPDPRGSGQSQDTIVENRHVVYSRQEITAQVAGEGYFWIYFLAEQPAAEPSAPILTKFQIEFDTPAVGIHWPSLIFFVSLAVGAYAILFFFLLPDALQGTAVLVRAAASGRMLWRWGVGGLLLLAAMAMVLHPEHWRDKSDRFDDYSAIGVAAHLPATGYDPAQMVFRSRIRPALTAWLLPWAGLLPHRLTGSTFTPSDRKERMFFYYDRADGSYGKRIFSEASAFFALVLILGLAGLAALCARMGASPGQCATIFLFACLFTWLCFYNSASSAANFATTIAAAAVFWHGWQDSRVWRLVAAGLVFSFTILLKETFVVLGIGIGLYQLRSLWLAEDRHRMLMRMAVFWMTALMLPLAYYGLVLDTGFAELPANHSLLYYHQQLHKEYEALTPWTALKTYWQAFSIGLPLAGIGAVLTLSRWRTWGEAEAFFLFWMAGSLVTLTMPYIFPRFLIFSIPPFAFMAMRGAEWVYQALAGGVRIQP